MVSAMAFFSGLTMALSQDAADLVAKLDVIRSPDQSFIVTVHATETDGKGTSSPSPFAFMPKPRLLQPGEADPSLS